MGNMKMSPLRLLLWNVIAKANLCFLSDKSYLRLIYRVVTGDRLHLDSPTLFTEKMQWLKLYDRKPYYTQMVDKIAAKTYVGNIIGYNHIIPTIKIWDSVNDINFQGLPEKFVLKCNHDSGGLVICNNKKELDIVSAKKKLNQSLKRNFYWVGREWPYKDVPPKVFAETFIENSNGNKLQDYKFFCFNGEPEFLYISSNLTDHSKARLSYITMEWEQAPFYRIDYKQYDKLPPKPKNFELMKEYARKLSKGTPFLRVDFYEIDGELYFGELTFTPGSGLTKFYPSYWESYWGEKIILDK